MSPTQTFLLLVLSPLAGSFATLFLSPTLAHRLAKLVAILPLFALALVFGGMVMESPGAWVFWSGEWPPGMHYSLALSNLSCALLALCLVAILLAIWQTPSKNSRVSSSGLLFLQAAVTVILSSQNLIIFAAACESFYLALFILARTETQHRRKGFRQAIGFSLGATALLIACSVAYAPKSPLIFWALTGAILLQAGVVPAHTWLRNLFEGSAGPVKTVLIGCNGCIAAYAWVQFLLPMTPQSGLELTDGLSLLLGFSFAYAGALSLLTTNLQTWLACMASAQISLALLGLSLFSAEGIHAAILHTFYWPLALLGISHFTEMLHTRLGTADVYDIGPLRTESPRLGICLALFFLAAVAFPGSAVFASAVATLAALVPQSLTLVSLAFAGSVCLLISTVRIAQPLFVKGVSPHTGVRKVPEVNWIGTVAALLVIAGIFALGARPDYLRRQTEPLLDMFLQMHQQVSTGAQEVSS